jgi:dTDP-4-dehydrorhamnose 3,5-epimerase
MIQGVMTKELTVHVDERGRLMEMLRADEDLFTKFGQVYMTTTNPGVVKAWHLHKKQTDNVVCVKGTIKLAMYDAREDSSTRGETKEYAVGEHKPMLIQIPAGVYHGWMCVSDSEAIVINCPTETYDAKNPDEFRLPYDSPEIPYSWDIKHG